MRRVTSVEETPSQAKEKQESLMNSINSEEVNKAKLLEVNKDLKKENVDILKDIVKKEQDRIQLHIDTNEVIRIYEEESLKKKKLSCEVNELLREKVSMLTANKRTKDLISKNLAAYLAQVDAQKNEVTKKVHDVNDEYNHLLLENASLKKNNELLLVAIISNKDIFDSLQDKVLEKSNQLTGMDKSLRSKDLELEKRLDNLDKVNISIEDVVSELFDRNKKLADTEKQINDNKIAIMKQDEELGAKRKMALSLVKRERRANRLEGELNELLEEAGCKKTKI